MAGGGGGTKFDAATRPVVPVRHCDGCGAAVPRGADDLHSPARWGDVWFCDDCLRALPAGEVEHQRREIALRGVPHA